MTGESALRAEVLTVAEAASALGLHPSQVRVLIRRGELAGERIGSQWVVPRAALGGYAERSHNAGRPFSQRIAWVLLATLEGVPAPWPLAREERSRVTAYARRPVIELAQRLSGRAATRRLSIGPTGMARIGPDTRWLRGGYAKSAERAVIYVRGSDLESLFETSNAVDDHEQPNLVVRTVDDRWWPFAEMSGGAGVWSIVAEFDRYDAGESATSGVLAARTA